MKKSATRRIPDGQIKMIRQARFARGATKAVASMLAILFAWLKFRGLDLGIAFKSISGQLLFQGSLALYYFCWIFGLINDTREQELIYLEPPKKVIVGCIGFGIIFLALFSALCAVDTVKLLALFVLVFMAMNIVAWKVYIRYFLGSATTKTRTDYKTVNDFIGMEKLHVVYDLYLCGNWQWCRFILGGIIVVSLVLSAFIPAIAIWVDGISPGSGANVVPALFLLFVLVMEGWIWAMRFAVKKQLVLLDELASRYMLHI